MIRSKAFEVLGLDSNATTEEIKTAYAELSKKYHPEENPKEFQEIHEAYVTLINKKIVKIVKEYLFVNGIK